jgi:hypothetical protein
MLCDTIMMACLRCVYGTSSLYSTNKPVNAIIGESHMHSHKQSPLLLVLVLYASARSRYSCLRGQQQQQQQQLQQTRLLVSWCRNMSVSERSVVMSAAPAAAASVHAPSCNPPPLPLVPAPNRVRHIHATAVAAEPCCCWSFCACPILQPHPRKPSPLPCTQAGPHTKLQLQFQLHPASLAAPASPSLQGYLWIKCLQQLCRSLLPLLPLLPMPLLQSSFPRGTWGSCTCNNCVRTYTPAAPVVAEACCTRCSCQYCCSAAAPVQVGLLAKVLIAPANTAKKWPSNALHLVRDADCIAEKKHEMLCKSGTSIRCKSS